MAGTHLRGVWQNSPARGVGMSVYICIRMHTSRVHKQTTVPGGPASPAPTVILWYGGCAGVSKLAAVFPGPKCCRMYRRLTARHLEEVRIKRRGIDGRGLMKRRAGDWSSTAEHGSKESSSAPSSSRSHHEITSPSRHAETLLLEPTTAYISVDNNGGLGEIRWNRVALRCEVYVH